MPLYEYLCEGCRASFEALVARSASPHSSQACPQCGGDSRRILSVVNFGMERPAPSSLPARGAEGRPEVTSLRLAPPARLCWMDDQSAARLAAYKVGRGAEYDDTVAARAERATQRGEPPLPAHSHSPLADPAVFANRRAAAQKEKVAESAALRQSGEAEKS